MIAHIRASDGARQPLTDHLFAVAELARIFAARIGLADLGELLGLLHDLGKYALEFQSYLLAVVYDQNQDEDGGNGSSGNNQRGKIDHSTAGAQWLWQTLARHGQQKGLPQILALALASHHSGLIDCLTVDGEDHFSKRINKLDEKTHLAEVLREADRAVLARAGQLMEGNALAEAYLGVISEKITGSTVVRDMKHGLLARFLFSCLLDADRMDSAAFERSSSSTPPTTELPSWKILCARLEAYLSSFALVSPIDHIRQSISQHCLDSALRARGLYTLTVPTGGGKTLAGLRFALHHARTHGMERIVFVAPFTTILEQNAKVVRAILEPGDVEPDSVVLEHHANLLPEVQTWRAKMLAENWDVPVVFTTSVQLLESLFGAGTRGARRMHRLANAVLIFDEIQSLPVKCIHLFNNAINFLVEVCNSSVVLCTATQPLLDSVDAEKGAANLSGEHELMPDVTGLFEDLRRVEVRDQQREPGGWTASEIADLALRELQRAGSCLVVVNTRSMARELSVLVRQGGGGVPVYHLSTHMCPAHRSAVLGTLCALLKENKPVLCISTQLIEAGVDVDFASVIRLTAGLDSIAQAAGRCNRHGHRERGVVHVVNARDEKLGKLEEISIARDKAMRVLDDFREWPDRFDNDLIGLKAMRWYYQNYFFARQSEMDYQLDARNVGRDDSLLNLLSRNTACVGEYNRRNGKWPPIVLRQSFMTAEKNFAVIDDAPTQGVIVPYGQEGGAIIGELCAVYQPERAFLLLRRAQRFSVNLFQHLINELIDRGVVREIQSGTGILYLTDASYYSNLFGVSTSPEGEMELLYV
ncbi:MAG: CRISPR-associated endonuclease Cas3'' [Magnetococcales bacterium]|nr:CRISPR-associated endonuclease Cas3'' [Magnetococcales bacterium]MBF0116523.1 CRISPR-associated endonuclease Cas3'' [Magnetococcales bacterium]